MKTGLQLSDVVEVVLLHLVHAGAHLLVFLFRTLQLALVTLLHQLKILTSAPGKLLPQCANFFPVFLFGFPVSLANQFVALKLQSLDLAVVLKPDPSDLFF